MLERDAALVECVDAAVKAEAAVFVGNGNNARAVATLCDSDRVFYMVGSMGLGPSIAAGYANRSGRPTLVIEGDGNALMGLNAFPAVAAAAPTAFAHVILDNGLYETTGGQRTLAGQVDFVQMARGTAYAAGVSAESAAALAEALGRGLGGEGPLLIHAQTEVVDAAQHPRVPLLPPEVRARFESWHQRV